MIKPNNGPKLKKIIYFLYIFLFNFGGSALQVQWPSALFIIE